jgi:hypothetical protein
MQNLECALRPQIKKVVLFDTFISHLHRLAMMCSILPHLDTVAGHFYGGHMRMAGRGVETNLNYQGCSSYDGIIWFEGRWNPPRPNHKVRGAHADWLADDAEPPFRSGLGGVRCVCGGVGDRFIVCVRVCFRLHACVCVCNRRHRPWSMIRRCVEPMCRRTGGILARVS